MHELNALRDARPTVAPPTDQVIADAKESLMKSMHSEIQHRTAPDPRRSEQTGYAPAPADYGHAPARDRHVSPGYGHAPSYDPAPGGYTSAPTGYGHAPTGDGYTPSYGPRATGPAPVPGQNRPASFETRRRWPKRAAIVAGGAAALLVTAAAARAFLPSGNLEQPVFTGPTWELTVGEETNGDGTYKVCHTFVPAGEVATDGNGLGGSGCETSPPDPIGPVISGVQAAFRTTTGIGILIDLTSAPVSSVTVTTDSGTSETLEPFVMPQSQEQFVALEVDAAATSLEVVVYGPEGDVLESTTVTDLSVSS